MFSFQFLLPGGAEGVGFEHMYVVVRIGSQTVGSSRNLQLYLHGPRLRSTLRSTGGLVTAMGLPSCGGVSPAGSFAQNPIRPGKNEAGRAHPSNRLVQGVSPGWPFAQNPISLFRPAKTTRDARI